ncbi:MAG: YfhO family protein [Verrucomicrobiia bacterium]
MALAKNDKKIFSTKSFLFLAAGLLIAEYPEVVFLDYTFFFRDFGIFSYPNAAYVRDCFLNHELPLWNPLNEFGIPFLAQWNTMTLYPGNLFFIILPIQWSLAFFNLCHLIFGGVGMFLLTKKLTKNNIAAVIAGIGYQFNGVTLNSLMWCNNIAALGWMPFTVLAVYRALQMKTKKTITFAILVGAIQILTGAPEIIGITWLIIFGFLLAEVLTVKIKKCSAIIITLIILIGAVVCSLVQLLPFYQLLSNSHRYAVGGDSSWSLPSPINLIAPLINTFQWNYNVFFQKEQYWTSSTYFNIGIVWLAIIGSIFGKAKLRVIAALLCLTGISLSMGNNFFIYPLITKVFPFLEMIRFPIKLIILPVFLIPLLASIGFSVISDRTSKIEKWKVYISTLIGIILILLVTVYSVKELVSYQFPTHQKIYFIENTGLRSLFFIFFIALLFMAVRFERISHYLFIALVFLIFFDVKTHLPRQNPTVENWVYSPQLLMDERPKGFKNGRVLTRHDKDFSFQSLPNDATLEILSKRLGLFSNLNLIEGVSKTTGMFSLHIGTTAAIISRIYDTGIFIPSSLADFLSIHWIVKTNKQYEWIERGSYLPLVNFSRNIVFTNQIEIFNLIFSPEFKPEDVVYLTENFQNTIKNSELSTPKINIIEAKSHKILFKTSAPKQSIITISQSFYPEWEASIDNQKTAILRANYGFQAIFVPEGEHIVKVVYTDRYFRIGLLVSLVSTIFLIILLLPVNMVWKIELFKLYLNKPS